VIAGPDLTALGTFDAGGLEWPVNYVLTGPYPFHTFVGMSWFSDSSDGWQGTLNLGGTAYDLTGSAVNESSWTLTAAPVLVGGPGTYQEPFTFSASLCGFTSMTPVMPCDAAANVVGAGTLELVVGADPGHSRGSLDINSISYTFRSVPEPGSLALLLTGLVGLRLRSRSVSRA